MLPAPLLAVLLSCPQDALPPLGGTSPHESVVRLAPGRPRAGGTVRVVDASTGRPVADATVEAWSEAIDARHRGFHRFSAERTGADGHARVSLDPAAAKLRVTAPGYLVRSDTSGAAYRVLELVPAPQEPYRLRLVDAEDRPIPGARITTTRSCSHDVPAFEATTDATGVATLEGYGLQPELQDLRVAAPGFAAIRALDGERAFLPGGSPRGEPWTVRLRRLPGLALQVLGEDGAPLAGATLHALDGEGFHVVETDADGRLVLPSRYASGELHLEVLGERHRFAALPGPFREGRLRLGGDAWPEELATAELVVRLPPAAPPAGEHARVALLHADGWSARGALDEPIRFPAGAIELVLDRRSPSLLEERLRIELAAGESREVLLAAVPSRPVEVRLPEDAWGAWLEAADRSLELGGSATLDVPLGASLALVAEGPWGERVVRAEVEAGEGPLVLAPEAPVVPVAEAATLELHVDGEAGQARGSLELVPASAGATWEPRDPGGYLVRGPAGATLLVLHRRDGFATSARRVVLGAEARATLEPVQLARLELGPGLALVEPAGLPLEGLHPGPLHLVLRAGEGERLGVVLTLAPGERRRLALRDGDAPDPPR